MGKKIEPSMSGKEYSIWRLLLNYHTYVFNTVHPKDFDPGFRINLINSCWFAIESFLKMSMSETVMKDYDKLSIPTEFKYQPTCLEWIKNLFKSKEAKDMIRFNKELDLKEKLNQKIISNSWGKNLELSTELGRPIEKKIKSWEFAINLYRLRNGLVHGQSFKFMKSHTSHHDDEVTKHYRKSLKYLNTKKVIDLQKIIDTQDITLLLNRDLSYFISVESANVIDDINQVYNNTFQSYMWSQMRNPPQKKKS